ncbi:uncharacterized protein EDB91DRAFT_1109759 [Suillus paluster]|uniref:uncharacterized protein n=1 Tax=Suillus paluster TaxID=48578 RepID=UPI001B85E1C7|nr:uncharacterized protein EDB91DRAFT_1109759 [Suillus paluster]KAG1749806.1 hypothetical protein EDB91DRAFT_1109759 [Suillus paluster]
MPCHRMVVGSSLEHSRRGRNFPSYSRITLSTWGRTIIPDNATIHLAHSIGTILDAVKVETNSTTFFDRHLMADGHIPGLSSSSGPRRSNTVACDRPPTDGLLQLSLRLSVLEQKFLWTGDIQVGEVLKGTEMRH